MDCKHVSVQSFWVFGFSTLKNILNSVIVLSYLKPCVGFSQQHAFSPS